MPSRSSPGCMVEDHGKANDRLIGLAKEDGIAVPHGSSTKSTRRCAQRLVEGQPAPNSTWPTSRGR